MVLTNRTDAPLPAAAPADIRAFTSLTIHGLLTSSTLTTPLPPTKIDRIESFPAKRYTCSFEKPPDPVDFSAMPIPTHGAQLQLVLGDCISQGRSGITYNARIHDIIPKTGAPRKIAKDLCLKFAKPRFSRSLAREAWFYEQLAGQEGYEGVVTPRCYGMFQVSLNDCAAMMNCSLDSLQVVPWLNVEAADTDSDEEPELEPVNPHSDVPWPLDYLPDDGDSGSHEEDDFGSKTKSRWNVWQDVPNQPFINVLVIQKLGRQYYDIGEDVEHKGSRGDVRRLYEDLAAAGIMHGDIRRNNILRAHRTPGAVCPRHGRAHRWRIVDLSLGERILQFNKSDIREASSQKRYVGNSPFFGFPYC